MRAWHCAVSKPNQEARAAVELAKQDFEVFLPILDARPMFPRYLFVAFDRDVDSWGRIKNTRGCVDILRNGFLPTTIPSPIMDAIMAYRPPAVPTEGETVFSPGQTVVVENGPLAGIHGLFVADRHKRVYALLEILGKRVEVARDSIRAA